MAAYGLYIHVRSNRRRSIALLSLFVLAGGHDPGPLVLPTPGDATADQSLGQPDRAAAPRPWDDPGSPATGGALPADDGSSPAQDTVGPWGTHRQ